MDQAADPRSAPLSASATILDNFNRTTSGPYFWGTSSSGKSWFTFNSDLNCNVYTGHVNGQNGVMTGGVGAECVTNYGNDQHLNTNGSMDWEAPSWAFTAKFKTDTLDGSVLGFRATQNNVGLQNANALIKLATTGGYVDTMGTPSVPFTWQANTWYSLKWVVDWDDQSRVRVWKTSDPEPGAWTVSGTADSLTTGTFMVTWDPGTP